MQVKKQQLGLDMEQLTGSKLGKECVKAVHVTCLFNLYAEYIMLGWMNSKLKSRYADDTTLMAESKEDLKASRWRWKKTVKKLV